MFTFRNYSIKKKLAWMSMLASGTALFVACSAFLVYEWVTFRGTLVRRLSTQAEILGLSTTSALLFDDRSAAEDTLSALRIRPEILSAGLYTPDGQPFAVYWREGQGQALSLPDIPAGAAEAHRFGANQLVVVRQVVLQGERVGRVYIESDLSEMNARLKGYAGIVVVVLVLSFLVAIFFSSRLQAIISQPVMRLADAAAIVSRDKNYTLRVAPGNRDEVGLLIEAFNDMLKQIQDRDAALQRAQNELEKRVEERTAELAATNKELEAFTYSVSHDLRSPLRHIDGFSQLLVEEHGAELSEPARGYLGKVRGGAQQMGQLIDDLLAFSRVGRRELHVHITGLNSLVEEVRRELGEAGDQRQIEWRIEQLPFVECDPALMKQVFVNLLSNAVKFTRPRNPARIEVGQCQWKGQPAIYVRDNGVGFSMKYADKLFGVFQRFHRQEDFEGTGVGLATVQRIIHKHGGHVWAEAKLDKGTTFYFSLGAAEAAAEPDSRPSAGGVT